MTNAIPLNRFFRLAVLAGVERSVRLHIDRGDDLNARDSNGRTPLMLSAAGNLATICHMLLDVGADVDLLDPSGNDALAIALAAGALDAASVITANLSKADRGGLNDSAGPSLAAFGTPKHIARESAVSPYRGPPPPFELVYGAPTAAILLAVDDPALSTGLLANVETLAAVDGQMPFDLTGWEAESDKLPPEDDPALSVGAVAVQSAISGYQPIDTSADWENFEVFLPNQATALPRADDSEARERLRLVLLRAIREGSVPHSAIEDLTLDDDGEPNEEACALLSMVVNDLGAETDERFEYSTAHESFEVFVATEEAPDEEEAVAEALTFVDDLAQRRNEPLRIYQREFQRETLLTAEAEAALGQAMERGIENALDALALWPFGISVVLDAAYKVTSGARPLRWLSSGPLAELQEGALSSIGEPNTEPELPVEINDAEDERDAQLGIDPKESSDELSKFSACAELLADMAISTNVDDPEWRSCREVLASLGLTRGFLMELADSVLGEENESALAFEEAINGYRRARDQMTVANLKLVFSIAKKYLFSGQLLDDLLQEGNIGLIKAADRYDWRRGFKFSTYATWWIRQQVGRFVADTGRTIRVPVHVYEKTQRVAQAARSFELRHGHAATAEDIATLVELPVDKVVALLRATLEPLPLHEVGELDSLIAADVRDQFTVRDPMEIVENNQLIGSVDRFLSTLKPKEANILRMRFGIGVQDSMTLEEIGAQLDLTRERIRQIEAKALLRLKHPVRLDRLLRELGAATSRSGQQCSEVSRDAEGEDEGGGYALTLAADVAAPQPKTVAKTIPAPERSEDSRRTALESLLAHARAIGFNVEQSPEGADRRIWVRITETPDNHSRKIVQKLIDLGFEFSLGKGYWR